MNSGVVHKSWVSTAPGPGPGRLPGILSGSDPVQQAAKADFIRPAGPVHPAVAVPPRLPGEVSRQTQLRRGGAATGHSRAARGGAPGERARQQPGLPRGIARHAGGRAGDRGGETLTLGPAARRTSSPPGGPKQVASKSAPAIVHHQLTAPNPSAALRAGLSTAPPECESRGRGSGRSTAGRPPGRAEPAGSRAPESRAPAD
jgi:hypothetical protein